MANSRGLYNFVFLGFISGAALAFSCVGELNANSWELANVYLLEGQASSFKDTKSGKAEANFSFYFLSVFHCYL